jgi:hypothetical protein
MHSNQPIPANAMHYKGFVGISMADPAIDILNIR